MIDKPNDDEESRPSEQSKYSSIQVMDSLKEPSKPELSSSPSSQVPPSDDLEDQDSFYLKDL